MKLHFSLYVRSLACVGGMTLLTACAGQETLTAQETVPAVSWAANPLAMPVHGSHRLTVLSPTVLELELVTLKEPDPAPPPAWDFAKGLPPAGDFQVLANGRTVEVKSVGFKRRPIYAPLKKRDLRVANWLYLELAQPLGEGAQVEVRDAAGKHFPQGSKFVAKQESTRLSPAIHVGAQGFEPAWQKLAFVGYYLGSMGELPLSSEQTFSLLDASGKSVFQGKLRLRADEGWSSKPYQQVMEADFSAFKTPGTYRVAIPGLGVSRAFSINNGAAALLARTYALGLYNQRCGTAISMPFTRHTHIADHMAPADVPTQEFKATNNSLKGMSENKEKKYTAPQLVDVQSALFPFVKSGKIDVSGGHHDAGDYSIYTTNTAQLISQLCFAADVFPGAGELDNLGIPESGDGKSDLLQEAKWEADYLLKMQDDDGGFFFLKYPRERKYENDVLPENGDPQVVFPKNTAASAAAVASLAQMASSPRFKTQFPEAAAKYRAAAIKGWKFLEDAIAKFGRDGSYQKVSHYGDAFGHEDELIWAAVEMFLLTGDAKIREQWLANFNPTANEIKHWGWWRMYNCFGSAIRSYAFAAQSGRMKESELDARLLKASRDETLAGAVDQANRAAASSYGTSFPVESKRYNSAGWYFSSTNTLDLAAGYAIEPRPEFFNAILTNFGFEWGANPQNVAYVTGVGDTRQRDVVHQYAQNDRRVLPPTGIPQGNIVSGFAYLDPYKREPGQLTYPNDGDPKTPYAQMDRWSDSFNVTAEFVVSNQTSALAGAALLMGQSALRSQSWRTTQARITGVPQQLKVGQSATFNFEAPGLDSKLAKIVWEVRGQEPIEAHQLAFKGTTPGPYWVEAEALWPDGRRVAAAAEFAVTPVVGGQASVKSADTVALVDFNGDSLDSYLQPLKGQGTGAPLLSAANVAWMEQPVGKALQIPSPASWVDVPIELPENFKLSGRFYLERVIPGISNGAVLALGTANGNELIVGIAVNKYPKPWMVEVRVGDDIVLTSTEVEKIIMPETWQHWEFIWRGDSVTITVDNKKVYEGAVKNPNGMKGRLRNARLTFGRVTGWFDDVHVTALPKAN